MTAAEICSIILSGGVVALIIGWVIDLIVKDYKKDSK